MKNRPIVNKTEIENIIRRCLTCNIAMVDPEGNPYVIPMNFGYAGDIIYFHGSPKGKKADVLKNHAAVCVNFSTDHELRYVNEEVACSWSMRYRSVIAYGKAEFVEDLSEKIKCLNIIMSHYTDRDFQYSEPSLREVMVFKVHVEKLDGRVYGY